MKIVEKTIVTQIYCHLINNDIVDNFQFAYKAGHSCETALLRVYNYINTTIGRCIGAMLVLLYLSAACDTIDHNNLFCIPLLLFVMIRSVVKSFNVPGVEGVAARMCNEAPLARVTDSTPKKTWLYLTLVLDG